MGASLVAQMVKNLPAMCDICVRSLDGKIPWKREWLTTPVFLPGECHGEINLAGTVQGIANSQTPLSDFHTHTHTHSRIIHINNYLKGKWIKCTNEKT